MKLAGIGVLLLAAVSLSACGYSRGERALSGAGIGGAVGAAGTAIVGGPVLAGAAVGAATGALVGAATRAGDLDLNRVFD